MKKLSLITLVIFMYFAFGQKSFAQKVVHPTKTSRAIYFDTYGPLIEINKNRQPLTKQEVIERNEVLERNEDLKERFYPFASTALPKGPDPVWQNTKSSKNINTVPIIIQNFAGKTSPYDPPDCNGAVGPNYFFQTINIEYAIYSKSGTFITGNNMNTLFSGVTGSSNNDGDPIILYDEQADRWLAAEFSVSSSPYYMLIAVSQTGDPTGSWNRWSFTMTGMPDYMKFGIWEDGYYMATNTSSGDDIYVFERSVMLAGGASPQMVEFNNPNRPNSGFHCIMPLDCDWSYAPSGTPGGFITINDDAWGGSDQLWVYECNVNWSNTSSSSFSRTQTISTASFDSDFGSSMNNITQKGVSQKVDGIPQVLMYRAQYLNFGGGDERIVCNHTVDVDGTNHAGVRWYELQKSGGTWSIRQQGTYAPDADSRWMAGISEDQNHEIGLAYSVASANTYPSIRCTGQSAGENSSASGIMDITEATLQAGTSSQTSSNRWGDYSGMSVDPSDSITFWFTSEYNANKTTKISAFRFQETGDPSNLHANGTSNDQVDLNWNLNSTSDNVLLAYNTTNSFGTPANGTTYSVGQTIPGGGTVIYYGTNTSTNQTGLDCGSTYYYKAWSYLSTNNTYSPGITTSASTSSDVILTEDFETASGSTPPTGWTSSSNGVGWEFGSNLGSQYFPVSAHTNYACSNDDDAGSSNDASVDYLISPALDLTNYSNTSLQFAYTYANTYGSIATVEVSTNGGSSWTVVSTLSTADWGTANVDLSAYDGLSNVKVMFHHDDDGQYADGFAVDDVVFEGCPTGGCSSPSISTQPTNQTECLGNSVTFNVTAAGTAPLSYQWKFNGSNISGATNTSYNIASISSGDAGDYTCYVTNACGNVTTNTVSLSITPATAITTQPISLNATEGDNVQFTVSATGSNLTYQWKKDGNNVNNGGNVSGATTNTLTITSVATANQGDYSCEVSGDCGLITSNTATLSVIVSVNDLLDYGMQINPNPSTGEFTITTSEDVLSNVKIYNSLGQLVFSKDENKSNTINIDLSKQGKGVYFIDINNNDKMIKSKIVIK